jgi:hypothetical protein
MSKSAKAILVLVIFMIGCETKKVMPERWKKLGMPQSGVMRIEKQSDENGLFIDYERKGDHELLFSKIDSVLVGAGYTATCKELDGLVRGYTCTNENLVVKLDLGDYFSLSIYNDKTSYNGTPEDLFYKICFKGYKLGEKQVIYGDSVSDLKQIPVY